ncbi:MAG TPA: hypothetical protein VMN79_09420 [Casimicrobiaceae bacterium]|nr:hypothetical protein [Casimicrobiaceae bacterium]
MADPIADELRALYGDASKHSGYQSIPDFVSAALGYSESIDEGWRGDKPRLAYLRTVREPLDGELWGDFGANTGFFTLSMAHAYPKTRFAAIEPNPNHAEFIQRVAGYFGLGNVEVIPRAIGLRELRELPKFDFLLHMNVLHHAGHDFDNDLVHTLPQFPDYALRYLNALRSHADGMLFQIGSNWGGSKQQPLIGVREDFAKRRLFTSWLEDAGWRIEATAYPRKERDKGIAYHDIAPLGDEVAEQDAQALNSSRGMNELDVFPGEFYRRPLFLCASPTRLGSSVPCTERTAHE